MIGGGYFAAVYFAGVVKNGLLAAGLATTATVQVTAAANLGFVPELAASATIEVHARGNLYVAITETTAGITLGGVDVRGRVRMAGLSIKDILNDAPSTASLVFDGPVPPTGDPLRITIDRGTRVLFAGSLQTVECDYQVGKPQHVQWPTTAIDDTARANRHRPFGTWINTSASTIAAAIAAAEAAGMSTAIEPGLPPVTITFDGSETLIACLVRLANLFGGYAKVEDNTIYLFSEDLSAPPDPIDAAHPPLNDPPITITRDASNLRTRVYGKGYGESVPTDVAAGETIVPLVDGASFTPSGGQAIAGTTPDGAQWQILSYTSVVPSAGGTLIGPGAQPASAPTVALAVGAGVTSGGHAITVVFKTAAGRSLAGPYATIVVGAVAPPTAAVVAGTPTGGGAVDAGAHTYVPVFRTAGGATTPGPVSNAVTAIAGMAAPVCPTTYNGLTDFWAVYTGYVGGPLSAGNTYSYKLAFRRNSDGALTNLSTAALTVPAGIDGYVAFRPSALSVPAGSTLVLFREKNGTGGYKEATVLTPVVVNWGGVPETQMWDYTTDAALGPAGSASVNHTILGTIAVTGIPTSPDGIVTFVDLYRSFNGGTAKLAFSVANGVTSAVDTIANAARGADVPATNTATANQVSVSGIPTGGAGVTERELYMSAAGGGTRWRALVIANNTATTATIVIADAALAAELVEPTADTSGLTQPDGQVNAGAAAIPLASAAPFRAGGGWARLGQQVVRYTGISGQSLTGVPASGPGALLTTVVYGQPATPAPALLGVTGLGVALLRGSAIHIWVQRDDVAAQALEAARTGGDGIVEFLISDGRRTEASLRARCDADLALFARPIVTVTYATRDPKTKSGKPVTINLSAPTLVNELLTIQDVTITEIDQVPRTYPRYSVTASSVRWSLEDTLRRLIAAAGRS